MMGWGIRAQILWALAIVLAFGLTASYMVTSRSMRGAMIEARVRESRQTVAVVRENIKAAGTASDAQAAALADLRGLLQPDYLYILAGDLRAIEKSKSNPSTPPLNSLLEVQELGGLLATGIQDGIIQGRDGRALLVVLASLSSANDSDFPQGQEGTRVCLVSKLEPTLGRLDTFEWLFQLFTAVILILAVLIGYILLGRIVVRPVQRLRRQVAKVEEGEYVAPRLPKIPAGELGELIAAFHQMAQQLGADDKRIQRQLSELEHANREIASAQAQLMRTEKLASVGELAAGVAHEIGNPLAVVQGYLEMLQSETVSESNRNDFLKVMDESVQRIACIIRDLLMFARPGEEEKGCFDVCDVLTRAIHLVRPQKRFKDIELSIELDDPLPAIELPTGRLEQVLLNLLLNAADATVAPGGVGISAKVADHGFLQIEISDKGSGIRTEDLGRIFDPFFTTKEPGAGTGLGLAVCHGIVTNSGGSIDVESTLGQGTTFRLSLPLLKVEESSGNQRQGDVESGGTD
jgi:two-component system NtrC family sensor kinase